MSSNTKIVLRKKPNKDGLFPLAIRITKNRRSVYHYIGHYIDLKFWDETNKKVRKSHPNAASLNNLLISKLSEANKSLMDLQSANKDFSVIQIKKELYIVQNTNFFDLAQEYLDELKLNKKFSRLSSDKPRINHLKRFNKSDQLTFQEIDEDFLKKFMVYLREKRKVTERSVINNLIVIRTLYNRAIKSGIVDRKLYPFGSNKIKIKFPETRKVGLTIPEIQKIEGLSDLTPKENHARNIWLFSFYFAGIRSADVFKIRWRDIYDERLHYRMNKNSKLISLKIPNKIYPIIDQYKRYKRSEDDFIFMELKTVDFENKKEVFSKTTLANKYLNKHLKKIAEKAGINKKLTMHIARHSFGNISGDKIPVQILQKLYRHSSITTTMMYQSNFMTQETDKALNSIVTF